MSELGSRLRSLDAVAVAVVLVVGYVYVQALRAFVAGLLMPFLARDLRGSGGNLVGSDFPYAHYFWLGDRAFYYGDVLQWGLTLALLLITLVLVGRRLEWRP